MSKWRKKPVEIEAVQFAGNIDGVLTFHAHSFNRRDLGKLPPWLTEALDAPHEQVGAMFPDGDDTDSALIFTLEGVHRADPGDWIIRGVKGELYPCKPDIFAATYEPAD